MNPRQRREFQKIIREQELAVRRALVQAFDNLARSIDRAAVVRALQAGNVAQALALLRLREELLAPVTEALRGSYVAGGLATVASVPPGRAILGFDGRHPRAEKWITEHAAKRVVEIAKDQQKAIQDVVLAQVEAGRNPRAIIQDIAGKYDHAKGKRQGGILGLTSQQTKFVYGSTRPDGSIQKGALQELQTLDPHYFTRERRDRRFDAMVRKAISEDKPLTAKQIETIVDRYEDRLLAYRAEVVARTESINALRAGRHEGYEQAAEAGIFGRRQVMKVWSSTGRDGRTRDSHLEMDGQEVPLGEPFTFPDGSKAMYPGDGDLGAPPEEVIQCRCIAEYRINWLAAEPA